MKSHASSCARPSRRESDARRREESKSRSVDVARPRTRSCRRSASRACDEIADHLVLRVERDRATAGELGQRNSMRAAVEPQLDAVMHDAFAQHARRRRRIRAADRRYPAPARPARSVASTSARLRDSSTTESMPCEVQQMRKHEAGGSRADDADLRATRDRRVGVGRHETTASMPPAPCRRRRQRATHAADEIGGVVRAPRADVLRERPVRAQRPRLRHRR